MTADEIPGELVTMLDEAAGRRHSETGAVRTVLAAILTRHRQMVLDEVAETARNVEWGAWPYRGSV